VAEIDGTLSTAQADELARRHGLERIASQSFPLVNGTIGLFRIIDRRPAETVRRELAADDSVRSVQPNFRYVCRIRRSRRAKAMPRNTRWRSFDCAAAHTLAHGMNVTIAVIDSGIDVKHPELANSVADSLRCARQQGRPACPRRPALPARSWRMPKTDRQRAGGAAWWRSVAFGAAGKGA